jgi:predicted nucleotidyltransferase
MQESLKARAAHISEDIVSAIPEVTGVCLYGSVARGEAGPESDLDLLVVGQDPALTPSLIRRRLRLKGQTPRVSIVYHTPRTLERYLSTGSRFLLHVQREGQILYDDQGFLTKLKQYPVLQVPAHEEIAGQLKRLELYEKPDRYNGNFLFVLSHIYAIGKAVVMAILAERGVFEFNRDRAFDAFGELFPDASEDTKAVARLGPFYRLVSRGTSEHLPFSYHDCGDAVLEAAAAVRRLADCAASS